MSVAGLRFNPDKNSGGTHAASHNDWEFRTRLRIRLAESQLPEKHPVVEEEAFQTYPRQMRTFLDFQRLPVVKKPGSLTTTASAEAGTMPFLQ